VCDGATVNDFLAWYSGVTRTQVEAVLVAEAQSSRHSLAWN
jgi:hypothetical protein